jgi:hypothetical protein
MKERNVTPIVSFLQNAAGAPGGGPAAVAQQGGGAAFLQMLFSGVPVGLAPSEGRVLPAFGTTALSPAVGTSVPFSLLKPPASGSPTDGDAALDAVIRETSAALPKEFVMPAADVLRQAAALALQGTAGTPASPVRKSSAAPDAPATDAAAALAQAVLGAASVAPLEAPKNGFATDASDGNPAPYAPQGGRRPLPSIPKEDVVAALNAAGQRTAETGRRPLPPLAMQDVAAALTAAKKGISSPTSPENAGRRLPSLPTQDVVAALQAAKKGAPDVAPAANDPSSPFGQSRKLSPVSMAEALAAQDVPTGAIPPLRLQEGRPPALPSIPATDLFAASAAAAQYASTGAIPPLRLQEGRPPALPSIPATDLFAALTPVNDAGEGAVETAAPPSPASPSQADLNALWESVRRRLETDGAVLPPPAPKDGDNPALAMIKRLDASLSGMIDAKLDALGGADEVLRLLPEGKTKTELTLYVSRKETTTLSIETSPAETEEPGEGNAHLQALQDMLAKLRLVYDLTASGLLDKGTVTESMQRYVRESVTFSKTTETEIALHAVPSDALLDALPKRLPLGAEEDAPPLPPKEGDPVLRQTAQHAPSTPAAPSPSSAPTSPDEPAAPYVPEARGVKETASAPADAPKATREAPPLPPSLLSFASHMQEAPAKDLQTASLSAYGSGGSPKYEETVLAQVRMAVASAGANGITEGKIRLKLHPKELGGVDIRVEKGADGRHAVTVMADRAETLTLLQKQESDLRGMLYAALKSDAGNTMFSFLHQGDTGGQRHKFRDGDEGTGNGNGGGGAGTALADAEREPGSAYHVHSLVNMQV